MPVNSAEKRRRRRLFPPLCLLVRDVPDVVRVLRDRAVGGEDTAARDVEKRHTVPRRAVGVGLRHALLGGAVGGEVLQEHIFVALEQALGQSEAADRIEKAVQSVLAQGLRTPDIYSAGTTRVGTVQMGDAVVKALG